MNQTLTSSVASSLEQKTPQAALVITNWNGAELLRACLNSIAQQNYTDYEVIVVDNASSDHSCQMLESDFPTVRLIKNSANLGLCSANNLGIQATKAEFVAILNNDTILEPDWLGPLVEAMQSDATVGMCASKMLLIDRPDIIESAGITIDKAGIAWGLQSGDTNTNTNLAVQEVFGACGGAALYRRTMLLEIGLFDEDFFVYLEDADVAWRSQWAGWRCLYVPQSVIYHAHSATIKEGSPFKTRLLGRNKLWLIIKNYPMPHLLWYFPVILLYELMALAYALNTGRIKTAISGRVEALGQFSKMRHKRQEVVRKVSAKTIIKAMHPVENPFTLFKRFINVTQTIKD